MSTFYLKPDIFTSDISIVKLSFSATNSGTWATKQRPKRDLYSDELPLINPEIRDVTNPFSLLGVWNHNL